MTDIRDALYIPGFGFDCSRTKDQSLGSAEADFAAMMERAQAAREARERSEAGFSRRELTGEELGELAEKYDPNSMTQEEYDALLEELVEKGVLKKSELTSLGYRGMGMVLLGQVDSGSFHDIESWRNSLKWAVRSNTIPADVSSLDDFDGNALAMAKLFSRWEPAVESNAFLAQRYDASTALLDIMKAIVIAKAMTEETV